MPTGRCALRRLALALVALVAVAGAAHAQGPRHRDILWEIVRDCVDSTVADYCTRCTRPIAGRCPRPTTCRSGSEVWALTEQFVAIRDIKMCDCAAPSFVHGLAMPRAKVAGTESPGLPPGIWSFAWEVARARIARPEEIALAINAPGRRSQDQLHVHVVRLESGARERLLARRPSRTERLDAVWDVAATLAAARGVASYGVLVAELRQGEFLVDVSPTPEADFTVALCPVPRSGSPDRGRLDQLAAHVPARGAWGASIEPPN